MPSERSRRRINLARKLGNARSVGAWQRSLAGIALIRGDEARAWRLFDEILTIHRSLDDAWGISHALSGLALLALEADDAETAAQAPLRSPRDRTTRATTSRDSRMPWRCRRGSPPRTACRRSPFGCTPTPRCSASFVRDHTGRDRMARPDTARRRPPLPGRRGDVREGVGAWPRDDLHRGHRPGDPGASAARAKHAVARAASGGTGLSR